ncbi:MAG: TIR domain-containing protein [Thermoplasmata archaeon]|nr:MAG: TIR domain-containing protein [Thermoplasmata archaeon]
MNDIEDSPDYAAKYSAGAKKFRKGLSPDHLQIVVDIENEIVENPKGYPGRTVPLSEDIFIYKHPQPPLEITYRIDSEKEIIHFLHMVTPMLEVSKSIFISYSHEDADWLFELRKWLHPLEQAGLIKVWDDTEIMAGDNWQEKIESKLAASQAAILLISQDYLTSDFIKKNELPPLLEAAKDHGVNIFWIAVRPSTIEHTEIAKYQAVHKDPPLNQLKPADQEREFLRISNEIKDVIEKQRPLGQIGG